MHFLRCSYFISNSPSIVRDMKSNSSSLLVSLDGLSASDFDTLKKSLPFTAQYLNEGTTSVLDAGILSSCQAIWAEVLTGVPWHSNGCSGYSFPGDSLNQPVTCTEKNLTKPLKLLDVDAPHFVLNTPLLLPQIDNRIWLSDGSMPLAVSVSPRTLEKEEPFRGYIPRPANYLVQMLERTDAVLTRLVDVEKKRFECALNLIRNYPDSNGIVRITAFEHLAHAIGADFLSSKNTRYSNTISDLLSSLDSWLSEVFASGREVLIISPYSHIPCHAQLNINSLLEKGGYLSLTRPTHDTAQNRRLAAMDVLKDQDDPMGELEVLLYKRGLAKQLRFDTTKTVAASPSAGCIWLNRDSRFKDGKSMNDVEARKKILEIEQFLQDNLSRVFDDNFAIFTRSDEGNSIEPNPATPDIYVYIAQVEMHNNYEPLYGPGDKPRSVHHPRGFFWTTREPSYSYDDHLPTTKVPG